MSDYMALMADFLNTATPEEWVFVATGTNYDDKELLSWMIEQPECPAAAAKAIYWYLGPGYFTKYTADTVSRWQKNSFEMLRQIEANVARDFYRRSDIGFNPQADGLGGDNWVRAYPIASEGKQIPQEMMQPTPGRMPTRADVPEGWDDGMPPHIAQAIWKEEGL